MDHLPPPPISRFAPVPTTGPLAALFAVVMKGFCDTIDMRARYGRLPPLLAMLMVRRLGRLAQRIEALTAKLRAGTLSAGTLSAGTLAPPRTRPRPGPGRVRTPARPPPPHPWGAIRPSRAFGWLGREVPESRTWAGHLERWLAEPEAAALLRAAPQAARLLRPLCHIAGLRPDPALLPPLPRRPRKPQPQPAAPTAAPPAAGSAGPPPDPRQARAAARAEARAEARWAAAYRRSLGLLRRE